MAEVGHVFKILIFCATLYPFELIGSDSRHSESNERQEFLGDRVLGLIVADMLVARFPMNTKVISLDAMPPSLA